MDEVTDKLAKMETESFTCIANLLPLVNSMLKMQLSSMESDAKTEARNNEAKARGMRPNSSSSTSNFKMPR